MPKIVYKELSYKIVGILFDVHKKLGNRYQEKYYQRAVEEGFKGNDINYNRELIVDLEYNGKMIGKYILDFLVDNKIALELKAVPHLKKVDYQQVMAYLKANKLELGILANFRPTSLVFQRILNSDIIRSNNL